MTFPDSAIARSAQELLRDTSPEHLVNHCLRSFVWAEHLAVIDDVASGDLVMGYTDPFASSTGLNFLVTVLDSFAGGEEERMLDPDVVSTFERFQENVPFVALTTLQMRESVEQELAGSRERVVAMCFNRPHDPQQFILGVVSHGLYVNHLGLALGKCAGLIKSDRTQLRWCFDKGATLN